MTPDKACPVVLRGTAPHIEILAFKHPLAGLQLVKGTIEPGEPAEVAALRELAEESGITSARIERNLGLWPSGWQDQVWALFICQPDGGDALPDRWTHRTTDDGGHWFEFFWHPLRAATLAGEWHPLFRGALHFIRNVA